MKISKLGGNKENLLIHKMWELEEISEIIWPQVSQNFVLVLITIFLPHKFAGVTPIYNTDESGI